MIHFLRIMKIIFIILILIIVWIYIINRHGNLKFWKKISKNPEFALKLISESNSWYIDYGKLGKPIDGKWDGPFFPRIPSLNATLKIYVKVGEYEKSQEEILSIFEYK